MHISPAFFEEFWNPAAARGGCVRARYFSAHCRSSRCLLHCSKSSPTTAAATAAAAQSGGEGRERRWAGSYTGRCGLQGGRDAPSATWILHEVQADGQAGSRIGTGWQRQDALHSFLHTQACSVESPADIRAPVQTPFTLLGPPRNFSRSQHHEPAMDGHRRSGTACKYVLWRRRSCGFWRRSSLWSSDFSFLSPVVCAAIGPPRRVFETDSGSLPRTVVAVGSHRTSRASCQKRRAGKKRIKSGSVFPGGSPPRPPHPPSPPPPPHTTSPSYQSLLTSPQL